jgi:DNA-binding PadR family transcriptional regulator
MAAIDGTASSSSNGQRWFPPIIDDIQSTGLDQGFVQDLALKIMYFRGQLTGHDIASSIHLPFQAVVSPILEFLKREQMCEVKGSGGLGAASYQYTITEKGSARAREQLERTTYTGPAPVPWDDYVAAIRAQRGKRLTVSPRVMRQSLSHLVLEPSVFSKIGPAVNSGRSIFLYGMRSTMSPSRRKCAPTAPLGPWVRAGGMLAGYVSSAR